MPLKPPFSYVFVRKRSEIPATVPHSTKPKLMWVS